jgi:hypothetical protein
MNAMNGMTKFSFIINRGTVKKMASSGVGGHVGRLHDDEEILVFINELRLFSAYVQFLVVPVLNIRFSASIRA